MIATRSPSARIITNADKHLDQIVDAVHSVLGIPVEYRGERVLLESAAPPLEVIIHIAEIVDAIGVIFAAGKGGLAVSRKLYERVSARFPDRRLQILLQTPDRFVKGTITFPLPPDASDEALKAIAPESQRSVSPPSKMRLLFEDRWYTYDELQTFLRKRKDDGLR